MSILAHRVARPPHQSSSFPFLLSDREVDHIRRPSFWHTRANKAESGLSKNARLSREGSVNLSLMT